MFCLSKLCFLCLGTNKNLKLVSNEKSDGRLIQKELKYCLPEIEDHHSQIPKYVCSNCLRKLLRFYKFKQICLQNHKYLKSYCQTLTSTDADESYNHLSVTLTDMKYQNKSQAVSSDQILPTVGCDEELPTGENLDNGTCGPETVLNNEIQCDAQLDTGESHSLFEQVDIVVKDEFLTSEDNADVEFSQELVKSIKCESISSSSDDSVSSITDIAHKDSEDSDSSSNENDPTDPENSHKDNNSTSNDSSKRRHKCRECHRAFIYPSKLEAHIRIHTGERPFKCQTCQKSFTLAGNLRRHKLTHTGARSYECDVCHKTFTKNGSLTVHKRTHDNTRSYQCTHCNYTSTSVSNFNVHMRIHTGEKPHHCHLCSFKCAHVNSLKKHILIHTGEKPYSCQHCQKSFTSSSNLKDHKRRLHRNEDV